MKYLFARNEEKDASCDTPDDTGRNKEPHALRLTFEILSLGDHPA